MGAPEERTIPDEEESTDPDDGEETIPDGFLKNALVAASLGAGGIHLWAAWAHSGILRVLIFFTLVAAVQLWLAAAVVWIRNVPWSVLIGGAVVNAGVAVVWILSRTTGVPYQPDTHSSMDAALNRAASDPGPNWGAAAHEETFGLLDTAASLLEIGVVAVVLVLWIKSRNRGAELEADEVPAAGSAQDPAATLQEARQSTP